MSIELHKTTPASTAGAISKKHTRSRGRAKEPVDPYASVYGVVPFNQLRGRPWTGAYKLDESAVGTRVLVFGTVLYIRLVSKKTRAILVLLDESSTVPCVIDAGAEEGVTTRMVRFAVTLQRGTPVDVEGVVLPCSRQSPIATTQKVEIQVTKLHSIGLKTRASQNVAFRSSSTGVTQNEAERDGGISDGWTSS